MAQEVFSVFFPILAVILHFFGLDSKSMHTHMPYIVGHTICPADITTAGSLGRRRAGQLRFGFVAVSAGHIVSNPVLLYKLGESLRTLQEWSENYPS
jgi:hypothetical protein